MSQSNMPAQSDVSPDFDPKTVVPEYVSDVMDNDLERITKRCKTSDRLLVMLGVQQVREMKRMNEKLQELLDRLNGDE